MIYMVFLSASEKHVEWLKKQIWRLCRVRGRIRKEKQMCKLFFAKYESIRLLAKLYYSDDLICLARKKLKIIREFRYN